jgi:hypothetical protein
MPDKKIVAKISEISRNSGIIHDAASALPGSGSTIMYFPFEIC